MTIAYLEPIQQGLAGLLRPPSSDQKSSQGLIGTQSGNIPTEAHTTRTSTASKCNETSQWCPRVTMQKDQRHGHGEPTLVEHQLPGSRVILFWGGEKEGGGATTVLWYSINRALPQSILITHLFQIELNLVRLILSTHQRTRTGSSHESAIGGDTLLDSNDIVGWDGGFRGYRQSFFGLPPSCVFLLLPSCRHADVPARQRASVPACQRARVSVPVCQPCHRGLPVEAMHGACMNRLDADDS